MQHLRLPQRVEDLPVRDFVPELAAYVLYEADLPRRARLRLTWPSSPGCCPRRVCFGRTLDPYQLIVSSWVSISFRSERLSPSPSIASSLAPTCPSFGSISRVALGQAFGGRSEGGVTFARLGFAPRGIVTLRCGEGLQAASCALCRPLDPQATEASRRSPHRAAQPGADKRPYRQGVGQLVFLKDQH